MMRPTRVFGILLGCGLWMTGCGEDSSTTPPPRPARNTYPDYQHISGYVNGVWTKDHNPYVITGDVFVKDGDTLVINDGVKIVASWSINVDVGYILLRGAIGSPIRFLHNSAQRGGGIFCYGGGAEIRYAIFEGNGKVVSLNANSKIEHSEFSGVNLEFTNFSLNSGVAPVVENNIFAGYWPSLGDGGAAQVSTFSVGSDFSVLDSARMKVRNNLFYPGIGDSTWKTNPYLIVDVRLQGNSGIQHIQGFQWPGNGNLFGDPKWVKYNYVGPSPAGISDNDYHLQPGSPAIGAASDGTNIGAY